MNRLWLYGRQLAGETPFLVQIRRQMSEKHTKSVVAAKQPFMETVEKNKKVAWCACGLSQKQACLRKGYLLRKPINLLFKPFCDGSHRRQSTLSPVRIKIEESCEMLFCGCKQTKNPPFCDGSHMNAEVQACNVGESI